MLRRRDRVYPTKESIAKKGHNMKAPASERFAKNYIPVTESGCWLWLGSLTKAGYGQLKTHAGYSAHRFSYAYYRGDIPPGCEIDHLCRVRCCVNPEHLEAVTTKTNVLRGIGITARNARKTACWRGHPFTIENVLITKSPPGRSCKTCETIKRRTRAYEKELLLCKK